MTTPAVIARQIAVGVAMLALSAEAVAKRKPEGLQMPEAIRTVEPRFPDLLMRQHIYEGEARVVALIDAEGKLADWIFRSYSHPALAREASEALRQWRFTPARWQGEPIDVRTEFVFNFEASGMVLSMTTLDAAMERSILPRSKRATQRIVMPGDLDEPLRLVKRVNPLTPDDNATPYGRIAIDFFVDDEGRPRMPVVVESNDDAFARCALEALSHWRFAIPTREGRPVSVRAMQIFSFSPGRSGPEAPKPPAEELGEPQGGVN